MINSIARTKPPIAGTEAGLRILFVTPYAPSPIRVRPYHLLSSLARRGHSVTLVSAIGGAAEAQQLEALRPLCAKIIAVPKGKPELIANCVRALLCGTPLQAAYGSGDALAAAARTELARGSYDIVHVEHLRAAEAGLALAASGGLPVLFDSVDCISLLFERALRHSPSPRARAIALLDLARTRRYEARYGQHFAHIIVTSDEDRWALATLRDAASADAPITVVPNGVDLEYWRPESTGRSSDSLVFSGKMSYHANQAAALFLVREIMPLVWRQRPATRVIIAGAEPGRAVRALGSSSRISVTGFVPDLRPYLAQATIAVAPIRYGVGVQNKVLEAMAMGAPVVAARQATVAIGALPGRELLTATDAPEFARQILTLLEDRARRESIGAAGRGYVERAHTWSSSAAALEADYRSMAARAKA